MFRALWDDRGNQKSQGNDALKSEVRKINQYIDKLLNRILESESKTVIASYEKKLKDLEYDKIELDEKFAKYGSALPDYDKTFRTALKLVFDDNLPYVRNKGFRTTNLSSPFKLLHDLKGGDKAMAETEGEISNQIFDTLQDWSTILQDISNDPTP